MEWVIDIKGASYRQLMQQLFTNCDYISCIVRENEELEAYFEDIQYELFEKKFVTEWPLTNATKESVPVQMYTFPCNFLTQQFFANRQPSLFSWLHPEPEDLAFWNNGAVVFASCSHEQYIHMVEALKRELGHIFV